MVRASMASSHSGQQHVAGNVDNPEVFRCCLCPWGAPVENRPSRETHVAPVGSPTLWVPFHQGQLWVLEEELTFPRSLGPQLRQELALPYLL